MEDDMECKGSNKIKHFMWKACHNDLAVKGNLHQRKLARSDCCPICYSESETMEHLLLLCPWTTPLWFGAGICPIPGRSNLSTLANWLLEVIRFWNATGRDQQLGISHLFYYLWSIWKARNDKVFNDKHPNPLGTMIIAQSQCSEYLKAQETTPAGVSAGTRLTEHIQWQPPERGRIKINVDAAFDRQLGKGFSGIVCRDFTGKVLAAHTSMMFAPSALVAEALAAREVVLFAQSLQIQDVIIESDSLVLVEAIQKRTVRRELQSIVTDIQIMNMNFNQIQFTWVR